MIPKQSLYQEPDTTQNSPDYDLPSMGKSEPKGRTFSGDDLKKTITLWTYRESCVDSLEEGLIRICSLDSFRALMTKI